MKTQMPSQLLSSGSDHIYVQRKPRGLSDTFELMAPEAPGYLAVKQKSLSLFKRCLFNVHLIACPTTPESGLLKLGEGSHI